jgi:hypothetical protein
VGELTRQLCVVKEYAAKEGRKKVEINDPADAV